MEVYDSISENIIVFARADMHMEEMLNCENQYKDIFAVDSQLWKILHPVVRLSSKLPSAEMMIIPAIQPNVMRYEIEPWLIRPAALPKNIKVPPAKQIGQVISSDKENDDQVEDEATLRRKRAAAFASSVEKEIFIDGIKPRNIQ